MKPDALRARLTDELIDRVIQARNDAFDEIIGEVRDMPEVARAYGRRAARAVLVAALTEEPETPRLPAEYNVDDICLLCAERIGEFAYHQERDTFECPCGNVMIRADRRPGPAPEPT